MSDSFSSSVQRVFATPAELAAALEGAGLDLSGFGRGAAKGVADLWRELCEGDASLSLAPLHRHVAVVELYIRRGARVLIEHTQGLADGRERARARLPAEKMRPDEGPSAAALRCLAEEMAVGAEAVTIGALHPPRRQTLLSPSYPGLPSTYTLHRVEVAAPGLPDGDFTTAEVARHAADPVALHHWRWVPAGSIER